MGNDTPAELLRQLLAACHEGNHGAMRLAERTEVEALRIFLHESAQQYRRAADDLRTVLSTDAVPDFPPQLRDRSNAEGTDNGAHDDIVAAWEHTECSALTVFRDAYDAPLPSPLADKVKRHFEAGVCRLEQLRRLQIGEFSARPGSRR
jgi:hypothetical protein